MPKKKGNGEGSIRQRKDGRWEGVVTISYADGKQKRKSVYGKTKSEALRKMIEIQHELQAGSYVNPESITLEQWYRTWKETYLKSVKPSTIAQYESSFRVHILPAIGKLTLQKITAPTVQRFYNSLIGDLSNRSIRNYHEALHKCINQAIDIGYLKSNPCDACSLPRIEKKEMHIVSGEDLVRFLEAIKGDPYEALLYTDIFCGMRQAEIIGLTWDRVDLNTGMILLDRQFKRNRLTKKYEFSSLKNGSSHTIAMPEQVKKILEAQRKIQEGYAKNPAYSNPEGFVFCYPTGDHYDTDTVYRHFKSILKRIGLGDVRFHDLRHSYAVIALMSGVDPKTVSQNLGHATVSFTLDVYGHVTDEMRKKSADQISDFIDSLPVDKTR